MATTESSLSDSIKGADAHRGEAQGLLIDLPDNQSEALAAIGHALIAIAFELKVRRVAR
jgi:hypothetical protein